GVSLTGDGESLIFQHGGKNAGFTNSFKAYAHKGNAVIIMTNADNGGGLISEVLKAIADYYGWNELIQ
ncbi:MAG: hypothetical protein JW833_05415, partial [Prolixibacteraceae bacterium]|nr:hypothetical protein [Prolixibacteraceae bacterium]